jgi:hypothetical protein
VYQNGNGYLAYPGIANGAAELAHYPLFMAVNRFFYSAIGTGGGTSWDRIHSYNPDTRIILYQYGPGARQESSEMGTGWLNSISRWTVSRSHPDGTLSSHDSTTPDPYILYNSGGSRIVVNSSFPDTYWLDFGSADLQDYWADATIDDIYYKTHGWYDATLDNAANNTLRSSTSRPVPAMRPRRPTRNTPRIRAGKPRWRISPPRSPTKSAHTTPTR